MNNKIIFVFVFILYIFVSWVFFLYNFYPNKEPVDFIFDSIEYNQENYDIAYMRLYMEKIMYPNIDIDESISEINLIIEKIKGMSKGRKPHILDVVKYFFEPGEWNDWEVYGVGKDKNKTKLLSQYLKTKKGNCLTTTLLFYVVAKKLDIEIYLSRAPSHIFLKIRSKYGNLVNYDTTVNKVVPDSVYYEQMNLTNYLHKKFKFLTTMTDKQILSSSLDDLALYYRDNYMFDMGLKVVDFQIKIDPLNMHAIGNKRVISECKYLHHYDFHHDYYVGYLESKTREYMQIEREEGLRFL